MGVVHTTCSTTMLIAMYFEEYSIYLLSTNIRRQVTLAHYRDTVLHASSPLYFFVLFYSSLGARFVLYSDLPLMRHCIFTLYLCTWLMVSPFGVPFVLEGVI